MSAATAMHQLRPPKTYLPTENNYQAPVPCSKLHYQSILHLQTSVRDQNANRHRRSEHEMANAPSDSYKVISYCRTQAPSTLAGQASSRSQHSHCSIPTSTRSTSSSSSNRRTSLVEIAPSVSPRSALTITSSRSNIPSSTSMNQMNSLTQVVSIHGKRYSLEPTKAANETILPPQSKSNQASEKQQSHSSRPSAYQTHINGDPSTNSSGSSSDYTSLHGLPEHNETTDKSQQSLNDERLHRSPRKANNHLVGNRMHSVSSVEDSKKTPIPTVDYTIEPIEIHEDLHTGNQLDSKQKAIREEIKRKTAENEQVLINVDEYASDILVYLREREHVSRPKANYMRKQSELTWDMRAILIDWLSEVADEYKLYSETLHLAVNFIDRFLSRMSVTKSKFQLIGTTALYLAAKCEEVYPPNAGEFAYVTDNAYTKKQVLKIEDLLLQTLHFEVSTVTTHTFLLHYLKLAEVDEVTDDLARYIAEVTLLDPECLHHPSSIQAAAILCLALHMCHKPPWSTKLKQLTGYSIQSFYSIMEKIFWFVAKANVHEKWAITKKYRHIKHHCVASIAIPTTLPYVDTNTDVAM